MQKPLEELTKQELGLACHLARAQFRVAKLKEIEGRSSDPPAQVWAMAHRSTKGELFRRRRGLARILVSRMVSCELIIRRPGHE